MILLLIGWRLAIRKRNVTVFQNQPLVSIVIPTRNEENNIILLLNDISAQSYQHIEVIIVDDHSDDATVRKIIQAMNRDNRFLLIENTGIGKKQALTTAIQSAKGSIIITTDADCRVNINWIESILPFFSNDQIKMVFGGVRISGQSFFDQVQALEFSSLIGSGAATSALGFPTMCNGANLAFRRDVFNEVGGYSGNLEIPSGDDEFLMRKIKAKYSAGIVFAGNSAAIVTTASSKSFSAFIQQRIRWAGKWRHNQSLATVLLAFFIVGFQVLVLAMPALVVLHLVNPIIGSVLLLSKVIIEYILLKQVSNFLFIRWRWVTFVGLQILYPFYVVTIGLLSNFLSFSWKGRTLKSLIVSNKG